MLAATLLSIHNLHTLIQLAKDMRAAILDGSFTAFAEGFFELRKQNQSVA
jgi:tRNA-guanine family transglycosylase